MDDADEPIDVYDPDVEAEVLAGEEANADEVQIPDTSKWNPAKIHTDYRNTGTFHEVFVALEGRLYNHTKYVVGKYRLPRESVNDLFQTAMGKAHANWSKYTQGTYALGWMKMIITNTALNERRRLKNEPLAYGDMEIVMTGPSYVARSAESIVIEEVTTDEIRAAFDKVTEPYREVLKMVILDEMPYAEAAAQLGIPTNTALTRVHRGRAQLRELLQGKMKDRGI